MIDGAMDVAPAEWPHTLERQRREHGAWQHLLDFRASLSFPLGVAVKEVGDAQDFGQALRGHRR